MKLKIFPIILDEELDRKIREWMVKNGFKTKRESIVALIKKGLET